MWNFAKKYWRIAKILVELRRIKLKKYIKIIRRAWVNNEREVINTFNRKIENLGII